MRHWQSGLQHSPFIAAPISADAEMFMLGVRGITSRQLHSPAESTTQWQIMFIYPSGKSTAWPCCTQCYRTHMDLLQTKGFQSTVCPRCSQVSGKSDMWELVLSPIPSLSDGSYLERYHRATQLSEGDARSRDTRMIHLLRDKGIVGWISQKYVHVIFKSTSKSIFGTIHTVNISLHRENNVVSSMVWKSLRHKQHCMI